MLFLYYLNKLNLDGIRGETSFEGSNMWRNFIGTCKLRPTLEINGHLLLLNGASQTPHKTGDFVKIAD